MQHIGVKGVWRWRERDHKTGLVVAEKVVHNVVTDYGLTNIGQAWLSGTPTPLYLAVESTHTYLSVPAPGGSAFIQTLTAIHQFGDTQLTIAAGQSNQETVTFTSVTGTGPYTYNLSGTVQHGHTIADPDWVTRTPQHTDVITALASELQYDPVNFPNQRILSPGGYSPGLGQWTIQFFFPGPTLVGYIMNAGIVDNITLGVGNLYNYFTLGINHNNTANDQEIDGTFTFSNV
jgi:hypothetical protein